MSPAGFELEHGLVAATLIGSLHAFVVGSGPRCRPQLGDRLHDRARTDTVRAPDAAPDRVPPRGSRAGFAELAPDLVAEVLSPSDRATDVTAKALAWLDAGVRLVWIVDPALRSVTVYRSNGVVRIVRADAAGLDGEDVLPGFRLALAGLFC